MRKPWATAAWRKKRAEFIKGKCCEWCGSKEHLTIDHLRPSNTQTDEEYLSFTDARVLCRRCAYARLKGMVLCKVCKKKYHPVRFETCFNCMPQERREKLLEWKRTMESEEEVPLVEVVLPCGSKQMVYSDQLEWGGILEVCMHQCPDPKIGGDVNGCEAFLKWYNQSSQPEE